jgi:hypothetical protein
MNRKQRRDAKVQDLSSVAITFRNLPPAVWAPTRAVDSSQTYVGQNDNALFSQALGGLFTQMGVDRADVAAALLFRAINTNSDPNFRLMVTLGIAQGLDYRITQKEVVEEGETILEVGVEGVPTFEPLRPKQPEPVTGLVDPDGRPL